MKPPAKFSRPCRDGHLGALLWLMLLWLAMPTLIAQDSLMPLRVALCLEEPVEGQALCAMDREGKVTGYLPDLAEALAQYLGRPLRILPYRRAELYTSLERGEADIVIQPGLPPPGLAPHLALSRPWGGQPLAVLAPAQIPQPFGMLRSSREQWLSTGFQADFIMPAGLFANGPDLGSPARLVVDRSMALQQVLGAGGHSAKPAGYAWPCLVLPLREALLTHRKYPTETRIIGTLPGTEERWQVAMSPSFAEEARALVDRFITDYTQERGFDQLDTKHLEWELTMLRKLGLPSYRSTVENPP